MSAFDWHKFIRLVFQSPVVTGSWSEDVSLVGAATSIIFVTTKVLSLQTRLSWQTCAWHAFCHNKSMFIVTKLLLQQNYDCHDKYLSWQTFWVLSWQKYFATTTKICDRTFVTTSILLLRQKTRFVMTNTCFVTTNTCLFCRDKNDTCDSSHQR